MPGEHVICLYSNSSAWFGGGNLRVHLDIEVGEHAVDYNELAGKEKLTELQLRVRQLLDQVEQISKEQNYQRVCLLPTMRLFLKFKNKSPNLIVGYCCFSFERSDFEPQVSQPISGYFGGPLLNCPF
jgi:hypothetical protein